MEDKETTGPRQERRHGPLLKALTVRIVEVYSNCSGEYAYSTNSNPKRTLTWPCNGVHNGGLDNAEHNYICHVGDKVMNQDANKSYEILESLGQGGFGQVLKCQVDQSFVALKISKNRPAYFNQGCVEANILKRLNSLFDSDDTQHIVRMLDAFVFRKHLCIAFELLDMNLLEFLKWNNYKGVAMATNQSVTRELLEALRCLNHASLIHCDLKPENVMVCSMMPMRIKLIDFGSACTESSMLHSYIQSRFYRSPEVILGLPYSSAIDLWSLGCISAELCLGLPLFPGQCEYDQLRCITKILGLPPKDMLATGSKSKRYFKREERAESNSEEAVPVESHGSHASGDSSLEANSVATTASSREATETTETAEGSSFKEISGKKSYWRLKTGEEYEHDFNKKAVRSKRSWNFKSVEDIVKDVPEANRNCFLQFLTGLFQMDPNMRWTSKQALQHPFVNEEDAPGGYLGRLGGSPGQRMKAAPSSTTGTPGSSPNMASASVTSANSVMPGMSQQQVPSPWHLPSPGSASDGGSGAMASDGSLSLTSGGERTSRFSDSDSASASAGSREGRRRSQQKFWKQMMFRSEASAPDFREALGLREGPVVVDPRFGRPEDSSVWKKARDGRRNGRRKQNASGS